MARRKALVPSAPGIVASNVTEYLRFQRSRLYPGDRVRFQFSGLNGYGDPMSRDPARVARDIAKECVSVEAVRPECRVAAGPPTPRRQSGRAAERRGHMSSSG